MSDEIETESHRPDDLPRIATIEQQIATYGQIVLWLRNMARWTKNRKQKAKFRLLEQAAIDEFDNATKYMVSLLKVQNERLIAEAKKMEEEKKAQKVLEETQKKRIEEMKQKMGLN